MLISEILPEMIRGERVHRADKPSPLRSAVMSACLFVYNCKHINPFPLVFLSLPGIRDLSFFFRTYHTHAAACGKPTSVQPVLRQAQRQGGKKKERKKHIIKAWEWLWSIKRRRWSRRLHQLCVQEGRKVIQHLFISTPCSLALWRGLRSLWDGR